MKDIIATDADTHGSMFVPMILGSDKTTVSIATGQQEYHPVYLSVGNVHNYLQWAHKDALVLIGFLPSHMVGVSFLQNIQPHRLIGAQKDTDNKVLRGFRH
jgi:hypothetical protein